MAKIAILNDTPEVVVLLGNFITQGHHEFLKRIGTSRYVLETIVAFGPDLMVVPLYRVPECIGLPITDYATQVKGAHMLEHLCTCPALDRVPIIVFAFSTRLQEMPAELRKKVRFNAFLTFPDGLQELNPTISSLVGPALGEMEDVERVRRDSGAPE